MSIRFVKDLFFGVFRFIMSSPGPVDDFEYPNHHSSGKTFHEAVARWKWHVAIGYQSMDDVHKSKVAELRWYKNIESLEHEYLVVTCRRAMEEDVYLRLERRPENLDTRFVVPEQALPPDMTGKFNEEQFKSFKADVEAEQKVVQKTLWSTVQKTVSKSKGNLKATDSVTRVRDNEGFLGEEARLIALYENFQQPFYVRDLAFLACLINGNDPNYQFFVHQCYWYARTLVNAAVEIYEPTARTFSDSSKLAGTYTVGKGLRPEFGGAMQVVVSKDCQKEVENVKNTVRDAIAVHDAKVQHKYYQQQGELQAAKKIAAAANERADAAEQQVRELKSQLAKSSNAN